MTECERLIAMINSYPCMSTAKENFMESISSDLADYLIVNGVIVPPCKVGDTVYETDGIRIYESTIKQVIYDTNSIAFDARAIGTSIFLTREEAEKALKEREGI